MGKKKRCSSRRASQKPTKSNSKDSKTKKTTTTTTSSTSDQIIIRGITNLGNTCFFNASLQALVAIIEDPKDERAFILPENNSLKQYSQFYEVMKLLHIRNSPKIINPSQLLTSLTTKIYQFNNRRQHDSHELIIHLISSILEEFQKNEITSHPFSDLFSGNLTGIVQCQNCQYRSCSINKFIDISLEIPGSRSLFRYPSKSIVLPKRITRSMRKKGEVEQEQQQEQKQEQQQEEQQENQEASLEEKQDISEEIQLTDSLEKFEAEESNLTKTLTGIEETSLQIIEPVDEQALSTSSNPSPSSTITFFDCLKQYTSKELLTVESGEGYSCPKCSEETTQTSITFQKRSATKRLLILDSPALLIFHFKRLLPGGKCSSYISFPLQFSPKSFIGVRAASSSPDTSASASSPSPSPVDLPQAYQLKAVIVHLGSGNGGHYIAYVFRYNQWFFTSDAATRKATESEVLQSQAYILMYRRIEKEVEITDVVKSSEASASLPSPPLPTPLDDDNILTEVRESLASLKVNNCDEADEQTDHEGDEGEEEEEEEEDGEEEEKIVNK